MKSKVFKKLFVGVGLLVVSLFFLGTGVSYAGLLSNAKVRVINAASDLRASFSALKTKVDVKVDGWVLGDPANENQTGMIPYWNREVQKGLAPLEDVK